MTHEQNDWDRFLKFGQKKTQHLLHLTLNSNLPGTSLRDILAGCYLMGVWHGYQTKEHNMTPEERKAEITKAMIKVAQMTSRYAASAICLSKMGEIRYNGGGRQRGEGMRVLSRVYKYLRNTESD